MRQVGSPTLAIGHRINPYEHRCKKRLAHARLRPHTRTITEEEIRQRVKEFRLKRDLGEDLSSQEERILAYAHYAAGKQAVRMKVGSNTDTGE